MAAASADSSSSTATAAVLANPRQRQSYASQGASQGVSQGSPLLPLGQLPQQQQLQQLPQQESPVSSRRSDLTFVLF